MKHVLVHTGSSEETHIVDNGLQHSNNVVLVKDPRDVNDKGRDFPAMARATMTVVLELSSWGS